MGDQSYTPAKGPVSLLAQTISISARFCVPLWSISAIFALPTFLLFDLLAWQTENPSMDYVAIPCTLVATYVCSFILIGEVSDIFLGGTTTISKAIGRASVVGVGRLLGADALMWIMVGVTFFGTVFLLAFLNLVLYHTLKITLVFALSLGPAFLIMTLFLLNSQVVVIERLYWLSALRRSASLAWQSKTASLGIALVFVLLYTGFETVFMLVPGNNLFELPSFSILLAFPELLDQDPQMGLAGRMAASVLLAASIPILNIFVTLGYFSVSRAPVVTHGHVVN